MHGGSKLRVPVPRGRLVHYTGGRVQRRKGRTFRMHEKQRPRGDRYRLQDDVPLQHVGYLRRLRDRLHPGQLQFHVAVRRAGGVAGAMWLLRQPARARGSGLERQPFLCERLLRCGPPIRGRRMVHRSHGLLPRVDRRHRKRCQCGPEGGCADAAENYGATRVAKCPQYDSNL